LPSAPEPLAAATAHTADDALIATARALTSHLDVDRVCEAVLTAASIVFGATSSWILLHDAASNTLRTRLFRGPGAAAYGDLSLPPDAGVLGLAFSSRQAVFVPDVLQEDRWFDLARVHGSGLRSVFMVPLVRGEAAIGVLGLDSPRFGADHPPTASDAARMEALAAQVAIAVTNAQLYEASEQDRRRLKALLQDRRRLRGHVTQLREEIREAHSFGDIIGAAPVLADVLHQANLVAPADTAVLLLGETGTGKQLVARLIHERSARRTRPFVPVNCAAPPEALVESELFGHERGAFTGALARKAGKFEIAHSGTLFLDEIGDLPSDAQAKLLRVLQDSEVQRVGGTQAVRVNVRVIAATNQDLEAAITDKRFRPDLFYRLSVFPIRIPPLRERRSDIAPLVRHYVAHFARKLGKPAVEAGEDALDRLVAYDWPGNVRELQNVIERAVILTSGPIIEADALALSAAPSAPLSGDSNILPLVEAERRAIEAALSATGWRISGRDGAAALLGVKPTTLHAKMKRLGIARPGADQTAGL
jgi:formate hydrogenlyase transcriptional activator